MTAQPKPTQDDLHDLSEAETLIRLKYHCSNEDLISSIDDWIRELLAPLCAKGLQKAEYLLGALDTEFLEGDSEAEFDARYLRRLEKGAKAEIPDAMFYLAHQYWERGDYKSSSPLYEKAASAGHSYAKWCFGLDLLSGRGVSKDTERGLQLIKDAAKDRFEGAIQFMSQAYANGHYGFPKDEEVAAAWQRQLGAKDLIRF